MLPAAPLAPAVGDDAPDGPIAHAADRAVAVAHAIDDSTGCYDSTFITAGVLVKRLGAEALVDRAPESKL